ncbi:Activating transcription factor [Nesidiocoris tenuis]|uniref:Activating transcription factor n=1 Tax=Nesidiocoris tenuis TaxID=355587 RepID=A0ABN7B0I0_9HEMI|nr:Activating transcription factor [Nesidiocoris tenuis]
MKGLGMELSLNKTGNVTSNETPTPTRFIRNCEAIGLFQDLNPFEETFKKAVENVKRGCSKSQNVSILSKSAGDELHTPQVFPEDHDVHHAPGSGIHRLETPEVIVRSEADTSITSEGPIHSVGTPRHETQTQEDSVSLLLEMPNGTVLQLSAKSVKNDVPQPRDAIRIAPVQAFSNEAVVLATQNVNVPVAPKPSNATNPLVKEKLKAFLDGSYKTRRKNNSISSIPSTPCKVPVRREVVEEQSSRLSETLAETDDDRKRKILERNREAAHRCRVKRKRHIENLMHSNKILTQEVTRLRAEVVRLQNLLVVQSQYPVSGVNCVTAEPYSSAASAAACSKTAMAFRTAAPVVQAKSPLGLQLGQYRKEGLKLDIAKASGNSLMDLDSPSIVRCDEVLSSVGPPTTPDEGGHLGVMERDVNEPLDKHVNPTTTVIQLNPNVLKLS